MKEILEFMMGMVGTLWRNGAINEATRNELWEELRKRQHGYEDVKAKSYLVSFWIWSSLPSQGHVSVEDVQKSIQKFRELGIAKVESILREEYPEESKQYLGEPNAKN